jgi:hypothetical protein
MSKNGKHSFQAEVFALIEQAVGHNNLLTVPTALIAFCGDLDEAAFLAQLVYWSDKGKREDGYVFKSWQEWNTETGLTRRQQERVRQKLRAKGFIDIKLKQANGNPTLHYRLDRKSFMDAFARFVQKAPEAIAPKRQTVCTKTPNGFVHSVQSITDTTPYPTSETTLLKEGNNGVHAGHAHYSLSFKSYKRRYKPDSDIAEVVIYFLFQYEKRRRETHPRLRPEQWRRGVDVCEAFHGEYGIDLNDWRVIVDKYFCTDFPNVDCDYRFNHFASEGILTNRLYEELY